MITMKFVIYASKIEGHTIRALGDVDVSPVQDFICGEIEKCRDSYAFSQNYEPILVAAE